jgi:citrate lyase beta subunit
MSTPVSLSAEPAAPALDALRAANREFARRYPGEGGGRQPLHTVYGGGHLFRADTSGKLGAVALKALEDYAQDSTEFSRAVGIPPELAGPIYDRVIAKLRREPVEDFRIDFEDGYGNRPDAEEDGHAAAAGAEVAKGLAAGTLPPFIGIRIKPLNEELRRRSIRTLDVFLTALIRRAGKLPEGFVVTLPKVTIPEQVSWFVTVLAEVEQALPLPARSLRFEIMIETPQIMVDRNGRSALPALVEAGAGRISAAHFGTYDYTAGCNITAAHQTMGHPACEFARQMMQVAFAGTGVWLSDGSTTVMPVPVHRAAPGAALTAEQAAANRASVHHAWALHYTDVRRSLIQGFYQGWDLHPAQLATRYASVYAFFLEGLEAAGQRLKNFVAKAAQATLVGDVFDDAATGQGLLNYFLRGINAGAITEAEAAERTGLTLEEFRGRSFVRIMEGRK